MGASDPEQEGRREQHNHGSGTFIGGDNHGGIHFEVVDAKTKALLSRLTKHLETADPAPNAHAVPCLPRELRPLFGREAEIAEGRRVLEEPDGDGRSAVVVTGPPGIGKSALALRLSRRVADFYPDGQFHIDLALSAGEGNPADLVLALLHTLHPDGAPLPEGRAQQLALLHATLSQSKVLLLVDDIVSEEALLEVLRMDGPFALVCTSRAKLSGLTGLVGLIELDPLPAQHSEELVKAVAGPNRLTDVQTTSLSEACAGHPLALHVAAAYLARRPKASVDQFLDDITNPDRGIRALRAGQTALVPVLESSFAALSPEQAGLFTTLGILPHMSVTPDVVAVATAPEAELDNTQIDSVTELLDSLFELSLIEQIDEDRFVFHEILHRFARLKSASAATEHRKAVIRQTCLVLAVRAKSATESIGFMDKEAKVPAQGNADALRLLNADRPGAVAMTEMARQHQLWDPLVLLASELTASLWHGSHWNDLDRIYQCVLEAGTHSSEPDWTATAQHNLAMVASHRGDSQRAVDLYQRSAETAHDGGTPYQMYIAQLALGSLLINLGRARDAIPFLRSGLPFWRIIEDRHALAHALGNLGQAHMAIGQLRRAEQYLRNSKNLSQAGSPADLSNRGAIAALLCRTGRMAEAAREASQNIERARAVGSREWEAKALMELAETPVEERPDQAPAQPLEAALAIYQDTGDIQGQIRALFRLGDQAADRADIHRAAEILGECANLAHRIGDYEHAARSLVYLASYHGGTGHLDEAETYFADALDMARHLGNPGVLAQTLQKRAEYLWHLGQIGEAVSHLTEAASHLEATEEKRALAQVRAALGEALIVAGRWREGAETLQSIVSVMSDHASPATKARASRALAILYSRRGLHREAKSTITKALDQCEWAGDAPGIVQCRMALGNVHARNDEWSEAFDQYNKAATLAGEQKDLHVLLAAQSHAALCQLRSGDEEQAIAAMTKLIPLAERLGMRSAEAALHSNIGVHRASSGDFADAATEFRTALSLIEQLDDKPMRATCLLNLARAYRELGDINSSRAHAREAFALHHNLDSWAEAGEALLLLGKLHSEETPDAGVPTFNDLLGDGQPVDDRVVEALRSRVYRPVGDSVVKDDSETGSSTALASMRKINVSDSVLEALAGIDLKPLIIRLGNSRQTCAACNLLIDETGEAELLLLQHPQMDHNRIVLRLSHPHCVISRVIRLKGTAPKQPEERAEVECILFGHDRAGIIADCYGGLGSFDNGKQVEDLVLKAYLDAGFASLQSRLKLKDGEVLDFRNIPRIEGNSVAARLEDNRLSITGPHGPLLPPIPLNFYPHWYQKTLEGSLIVVVGRNLQGMTAEDPSYLLRAMILGQAVGATVPLTVVRPSRNSPCPCMMRTGRKFKHCCGSSKAMN
ncbi:tetratricopeptide repeat protein [Streptomyces rimosus]|uniref:tetratricopeptide repeat protein n=1 Tax=Streptomyces rimosus TaxID=1927 RepID=UPI00067CE345|nr:tetratricopeptide repeat protein [Streptomyces rimosus]